MLPGKLGDVGVTAKNNRLFVEAVLYRYRAGIPWRDLPERFGHFKVVHTRFSRWSKKGLWLKVFSALCDSNSKFQDTDIVKRHESCLVHEPVTRQEVLLRMGLVDFD